MPPGASGRSSPGFSARPSGAVVQPPLAGGECPSAGRPQSQMCRKPCKGRTACCLHGSHRHNLVETVVTPGLKPSEDFSPSDSGEAPARRGLQGRPLPSGPLPLPALPSVRNRPRPPFAWPWPTGPLGRPHHTQPVSAVAFTPRWPQWPQCGFGHVHVDLLWAASVRRCPVILRRQRHIWRGLEAPLPWLCAARNHPGPPAFWKTFGDPVWVRTRSCARPSVRVCMTCATPSHGSRRPRLTADAPGQPPAAASAWLVARGAACGVGSRCSYPA